ncbi:MAG: GTP 3',8-cyclase MoaA [Thermoplasmata archaeon]|nr:MAG: GTP 3',8-cyclase MoaA [Thermoplasmata archaeon]
MLDRFGRNINNMRISVTRQCNLDCFYCHHEGDPQKEREPDNILMAPSEIEKIAEIGSSVGMEKLKITGGEPLLRNDIVDIIGRVAGHMKEVSMTTNGTLLRRYAHDLRQAGLSRVNVSFDAFNHETFERITGKDLFDELKTGVAAAKEAGLSPIKLNMVVLKSVNHRDIDVAVEYASSVGAILQLIEFETTKEGSANGPFTRYHYDLGNVEDRLNKVACDVSRRHMHNRKKYILSSQNNGHAEIEIVRGMHNSEFCCNCTRLRVTASGQLKPCLLREDNYLDIITPIRNGAADDELEAIFTQAVHLKEPYWRS